MFTLRLCWMDSGPEDNVAEYYQQQVEMLEGFNEMDALAERGFVPGMSKVNNATTPLTICHTSQCILVA